MIKRPTRLTLIALAVLSLLPFSHALELKLVADGGEATQLFGSSVAIDQNTIFVGAPGCCNDDQYRGALHVFERSGHTWLQVQKIESPDEDSYDLFGYSLATSGPHAIISAQGDGISNPLSGAIYFYEQQDDAWVPGARFISPQSMPRDKFGVAVDIDGSYAIVGAPQGGGRLPTCGSACIYRYVDGEWQLDDVIYPTDGTPHDNFGCAVAISGQQVVVGAAGSSAKPTGAPQKVKKTGSAYIYERHKYGWRQVSKLSPVDGHAGNLFGCSVGIDGDYAIVGACQDNVADFHSGSAYLYKRVDSQWIDDIKFTAVDADSGDFFGSAVALYQDYIIIGAPGVDGFGKNSGAVYSYLRRDDGWALRARKTPYDAARYDVFGASLALSDELSVIGAPFKTVQEKPLQGVAYIYDNIQDLALPVELASFSATCQENAVLLQWLTQSERDNLGFIIERKADEQWHVLASFQTHDELRGRGSSSMPTYYEFLDDSVQAGTTYHYRLADVNMNGLCSYHEPITIRVSSGVAETPLLLTTMHVYPAFPNPFNPETVLRYELHRASFVAVDVFDLRGRRLRMLAAGLRQPGQHAVTWNGRNDAAEQLGSGVYLIRIRVDDVVTSQKVVLMQ
ncbi:T9SS type A sorting domain-containing protein [candidate division KSB1 bacterium]|nr:T9SS type A sorting domain-containing protein [candidate division KSB1 bacterium]